MLWATIDQKYEVVALIIIRISIKFKAVQNFLQSRKFDVDRGACSLLFCSPSAISLLPSTNNPCELSSGQTQWGGQAWKLFSAPVRRKTCRCRRLFPCAEPLSVPFSAAPVYVPERCRRASAAGLFHSCATGKQGCSEEGGVTWKKWDSLLVRFAAAFTRSIVQIRCCGRRGVLPTLLLTVSD